MALAFRTSSFAFLAFVVLIALAGQRAQAVVITVGGTDYDVLYFNNGTGNVAQPTFADNQADLTDPATAPWWGDAALASDFANAYLAQGGTFNLSRGVDSIGFGYSIAAGLVSRYYVSEVRTVGTNSLDSTTLYLGAFWAYTVPIAPAAVPEIDGNVLAKALFCLFTLAVGLQVRRRRRGLA